MKRRVFLSLLSATTANVFAATASAKTPSNTLRTGINGFSPAVSPHQPEPYASSLSVTRAGEIAPSMSWRA